MDGVDYKIRVHDEELDQAAKKAKELEGTLGSSQANQTKATKEGVNARTQVIRDGLAQQLRNVRESSAQEIAALKEKLKKEEIDQKEYADRFVKIQAEAHRQITQIKSQKANLIPQKVEQTSGSIMPSGLAFAASAIGVGVLSKELMSLADHAAKAKANVEGLESIVRFKLGQEAVPQAHKALKDITASGLLSQSDGAAALKNLTSMGYGIDQASQIIKRNTDIAIKNRQAHYSVSESVRVFTEGVKNGNSVLTDATGITENLEPMLRKYGFTAQDLSDKVNGAAARQALLKEVMKQTEPFVGDAARASEDFTGVMAKLTQQSDETKAALGKVASDGLVPFAKALTGMLGGFTEWFTGLSSLSQKVIFFGTVAAALAIPLGVMTMSALAAAGSFGALAVAAKAAFIALLANPVFLVVAGIAAVVAAIVGINEATRMTPGQALITERQQLLDLAKAAELTVEQKKRLAEINRQLEQEYGPLLAQMNAELTTYERKLQLLGALDGAQKDLKKFVELANPAEYAKKVSDLELELRKLQQVKYNPTLLQQMALDAGTVQRKIDQVEAKLAVLTKGAFKEPEAKKTPDAVRVPVIFVRDQTSMEILQDREWLNQQMLQKDQSLYTSIALMRQNDQLEYEIGLTRKLFVVQNQQGMQLTSLQELEMKKEALERQVATTQDQRKKAELAAAQKHNQQLLDATKRRIDQEKRMKEENDAWSKKAATQMADFGDALLSREEGALYKYLANRIRAVTRAFAEELYAKAAAYFAMGNVPMALLYGAGGLAVQAAGEFAAREVENKAPKQQAASITSPSMPDAPSAPSGGGNAPVTNNVDNSVVLNMNGTFLGEAEYIRKVIRPELSKIAAEQGKVMFK